MIDGEFFSLIWAALHDRRYTPPQRFHALRVQAPKTLRDCAVARHCRRREFALRRATPTKLSHHRVHLRLGVATLLACDFEPVSDLPDPRVRRAVALECGDLRGVAEGDQSNARGIRCRHRGNEARKREQDSGDYAEHAASIAHEGRHGKTLGEQMKCKSRREKGQKQAIHCIAKSLISFL